MYEGWKEYSDNSLSLSAVLHINRLKIFEDVANRINVMNTSIDAWLDNKLKHG